MSVPAYPARDYEQGHTLLTRVGSFWSRVADDSFRQYLRAIGNDFGTDVDDVDHTAACIARLSMPVHRRRGWLQVSALASVAQARMSTYRPDDLQYGAQSGAVPGRPAGFIQIYGGADGGGTEIELPDGTADVGTLIQNLLLWPSRVWVRGVDFDVDKERRLIVFQEDLFASADTAKQDVYDQDGNKIDEEIFLWVRNTEFDDRTIWKNFGFPVGLRAESSRAYLDAVNSLWDACLQGCSVTNLRKYLAACAGVPFSLHDDDEVLFVEQDYDEQVIITTAAVYRIPGSAGELPAVGDILQEGELLCDAFRIVELSGASPDYAAVPQLTLTPFLAREYLGDISALPDQVPLEYVGVTDGKTEVRFELHGFPEDVEKFWEAVHARGVEAGAVLADYLDTRVTRNGPPGPADLPRTVLPVEFLLKNVFRNNLFVVRARPASFSDEALGLAALRRIRDVLPPHVFYVLVVELAAGPADVDLSAAGDGTEPGADAEPTMYDAAVPGPADYDVVPGPDPYYDVPDPAVYLVAPDCISA